jgi:hypothetical protein
MLAGLMFLILGPSPPCLSPAAPSQWAKRSESQTLSAFLSSQACLVDDGLPVEPFSRWFQATVGAAVRVHWTVVPGCFLKPVGTPPPEFPLCVQGVWSSSEQIVGQVVLRVGDMRSDGSSRRTAPQLEWLTIEVLGGGDKRRSENGELSELGSLLRGLAQPPPQ